MARNAGPASACVTRAVAASPVAARAVTFTGRVRPARGVRPAAAEACMVEARPLAAALGLSGCRSDRSFVLCVAEPDEVIDFALEPDDPGDGQPLEPLDVVPTRVGDGRVVVYGLTFPARRVRIVASRPGAPPVRWDYDPSDGGARPHVVRHWLLEPKPVSGAGAPGPRGRPGAG